MRITEGLIQIVVQKVDKIRSRPLLVFFRENKRKPLESFCTFSSYLFPMTSNFFYIRLLEER